MGNFFKYLFASTLGTILAIFLLFALLAFFGTVAAVSQMGGGGSNASIKSGSVLKLDFNEQIPERTNNAQSTDFMGFEDVDILGVYDIARVIKSAKDDSDIAGIYLNVDDIGLGMTGMNIIREAIEDFKTSDKFVVSYAKYYSQNAYYLSSVADKVYVHPLGGVDFRGFGVAGEFYKKALDKAGVKMEVFYAGKFKGATEPYRLTEFSEENELQYRDYINYMYRLYLDKISETRGISKTELRRIADAYEAGDAERAAALGIVDTVGYEDQALDDMRLRLGKDLDEKFPLTNLRDYSKGNIKRENKSSKNVVAVLFAEGGISDGDPGPGQIGDKNYMKAIKKIKDTDKVKAVVVRVNSPGGSAMASENIWRELERVKEAGKPVIISMGSVAASGGYYIAAAGEEILAEPTTLTGSIGVFGVFPNAQELLNDKIGITFDTIKTGNFSTGLNPGVGLTEMERNWFQKSTERTYDIFLQRVSDARDMSKDAVHEIAQGRIWTADRALQNGLVDQIGGLDDAIAIAAEKAGITDDYRTRDYPATKNPVQQLIDDIINPDRTRTKILKEELGELYPYYQKAKEIQKMEGIQARMPFVLEVR